MKSQKRFFGSALNMPGHDRFSGSGYEKAMVK